MRQLAVAYLQGVARACGALTGELRTLGCPSCNQPIRTKAIGRQMLACARCGRRFFARAGIPQETAHSLAGSPPGVSVPGP